MGGDGALGGAAELRHQAGLGLGRKVAAGREHVHHDQAEGDADGHVEKEEAERAPGERAEFVEAAELDDAGGERGEDQRDDDEEQQAQENLSEGIEIGPGDPAHKREEIREEAAEGEGGDAGDDADDEADQDAGRKGAVGFRHGL